MSINFPKNNFFFIFVFIFMLIFICFLYVTMKKNEIDCTSTFYSIPDTPSWRYLSGTMSVTFDDDFTGQVMFSGEARDLDETYRFERLMIFNYKKGDGDNYYLSDVKVSKYAEDDLNDDVFRKYIYASTLEKNDHLVISKIRNGYLMGNMIGPRHLCVLR